jgi:hypothetical protein
MRLYRLELKKPLTSEAVWGFVAICLLFNIYLAVSNSGDPYADFVGTISNDTGSVLGQPFHEKLARLLAGDGHAEYLARLKLETGNVTDVFDGYETADVGERYIAAAGATGRFAEAMRNKYSALQKVVYEKAAKDESLSLYFAGATYNRHQLLFGTLMGWLLIEGALISALLVLLSTGYENIHKTENLVYSTKKAAVFCVPNLRRPYRRDSAPLPFWRWRPSLSILVSMNTGVSGAAAYPAYLISALT